MGQYSFVDDKPKKKGYSFVEDNSSTLQTKKEPESSMLSDIAGGAGNLLAGGAGGAGSIGSTLITGANLLSKISPLSMAARYIKGAPVMGESLSQIMQDDAARREGITGGLQELGANPESLMFKGGKLAGEIAGTAGAGGAIANTARAALTPAMALKLAPLLSSIQTSGMTTGGMGGLAGAATRAAGGAITGGAAAGMIDPRMASQGAAYGAATPLTIMGAGKVGQGVANLVTLKGKNSELAKKAINEYNLPLGAADITDSSVLKASRSILNDAPVIGSVGAKQKEALQEAYNREVGRTFGAAETKLTPEILDQAKKRMGNEFDRLWNNNNLKVDSSLVQSLLQLETRASKLPKNEGASLSSEIKDLYSKMTPDSNGNLVIDGGTANKFQSYLRRRAESSTGLKNELSDMRKSIINSFNQSVSPEDAAALTLNRTQYKAFKTVEPLLNKGEVGVAGRDAGDIPAALLPNAVASSYQNAAGTPLADLSQIGSKFLVDRVARTGGSTRAALQNSMIGSMLGLGAYANPNALLALPAAYGANAALGNPALAKMLLNTNVSAGINPQLQQFGYQAVPALINR